MIRPHILAVIPMVNAHFSLLPRWRGAAPVERALLAGDSETGVCIMALEEGLDTGGCTTASRRRSPTTQLPRSCAFGWLNRSRLLVQDAEHTARRVDRYGRAATRRDAVRREVREAGLRNRLGAACRARSPADSSRGSVDHVPRQALEDPCGRPRGWRTRSDISATGRQGPVWTSQHGATARNQLPTNCSERCERLDRAVGASRR